MKKEKIETAVLVPILDKVSQENDFFYGKKQLLLSDTDMYNPSIDMIISQLPTTKIRELPPIIHLFAFDLTTWKEPEQIKNKISKFLNNFLLFKDSNQRTMNLNGVDHRVQMYYYVISPVKTLKSQDNKNPIKNYLQEIKD